MTVRLQNEELIDYERLKTETKRLNIDKKRLINEINSETKKLSDIRADYGIVEVNAKKIIAEAKEEAKKIVDKAKEKQAEATKLDTEVKGKLSEAAKATKLADDLIKSNLGKERSLSQAKESVTGYADRLKKAMEMIRNVL